MTPVEPASTPGASPVSEPARQRFPPVLALAGLAALAVALTFVVGHGLFPLGSINHDEPMYTFGARLLRTGHATLPASFAPFRPWNSGVRDGRLVLAYPPVWSAVLAVGDVAGSLRLAVAATAGVAVALLGLLGRELFGRWREAILAAAFLVLSPLFVFQTGTYLAYVFQLALDIAIAWLLLSSVRRWPDSPRRAGLVARLVGAGACWGVAVFARPYDALLLVLPLGLGMLACSRREPRQLLPWVGWPLLGALPPVAAMLAYNGVTMGGPFRSVFSVTGPYNKLLFGRRGIFPSTTFPYTRREAVTSVARNLQWVPGWVFGGIVLVVLAAYGLWRTRRGGPAVWAVAGIAVSFSLGYALFWSPFTIVKKWPGVSHLGPFYHLSLLIPLTLFAAAGLSALLDRSRVVGTGAIALMVAVTAVGLPTKIDLNRKVTHEYRAIAALVDRAQLGRSVLFMEDRETLGYLSAAPFLENRPDLDQEIVYAAEGGPADLDVIARLPSRLPAALRAELRPGDELFAPTRYVQRLAVESGSSVPLHLRVTNTTDAPTVTLRLSGVGPAREIVVDRASHRGGAYDVELTLVPGPAPAGTPATTVGLRAGKGTLAVGLLLGKPGLAPERYERRYPYISDSDRVRILTPGVGRYLFQFGKPTWLKQQVDAQLAERA